MTLARKRAARVGRRPVARAPLFELGEPAGSMRPSCKRAARVGRPSSAVGEERAVGRPTGSGPPVTRDRHAFKWTPSK
eukprot:2213362-Prymnesium_polylepis.1